MKTLKKASALMLAVMMLLIMTVPVSAENGTITINNAISGHEYSAYKMMELSYDDNGTPDNTNDDGYVYYLPADTTSADWYDFLTSADVKGVYITIKESNGRSIVSWVSGESAEDFAELAQAYAKDNNLTSVDTQTASGNQLTLTGAGLGYYLVTSSTGALVVLNTATPNVTIDEKNEVPTLVKKVWEEDSSTWEDLNRVEAGEAVHYRIQITVKEGAKNYILHDVLDNEHLSFSLQNFGIYLNDDGNGASGTAVGEENYTLKVKAGVLPAEKDAVVADTTDGCSFDIAFADEFLDGLTPGDVLSVYYTAYFVGTTDAVKSSPHKNTAWLSYGDPVGDDNKQEETLKDEVLTVSYGLEVLKYGNNNVSHVLGGAKFELYRDAACTSDKVHVHYVGVESNKNIYTVCNLYDNHDAAEKAEIDETLLETTEETGSFIVYGLDMDTYYLKEIEAPEGYNPLDAPVEVKIDMDHLTTDRIYDINVNNNTGAILPSTGGAGTTMFYILGAVMVLGAVVLLVAKKRMGADK